MRQFSSSVTYFAWLFFQTHSTLLVAVKRKSNRATLICTTWKRKKKKKKKTMSPNEMNKIPKIKEAKKKMWTNRSFFVFSESKKSEKSSFLLFMSDKSRFRRGGFQRRLAARHFAAVADRYWCRFSVHAVGWWWRRRQVAYRHCGG